MPCAIFDTRDFWKVIGLENYHPYVLEDMSIESGFGKPPKQKTNAQEASDVAEGVPPEAGATPIEDSGQTTMQAEAGANAGTAADLERTKAVKERLGIAGETAPASVKEIGKEDLGLSSAEVPEGEAMDSEQLRYIKYSVLREAGRTGRIDSRDINTLMSFDPKIQEHLAEHLYEDSVYEEGTLHAGRHANVLQVSQRVGGTPFADKIQQLESERIERSRQR